MQEPLISIVIPVYKVETWLDRCVEATLAQTYRNLEIILVDDGSPDRCGALCDEWEKKDSRIRVIHKENGGLSSARNAGIDVAQGEYLMFLDSDDVMDSRICSHLYKLLQDTGAGIAICEVAHVFDENNIPYTLTEESRLLSSRDAIAELWYQKSFMPTACAKLYRRDVFASHRFTVGLLYEDVDLMHLLLAEAGQVVCNTSALYGYIHRDNSITTKPFSVRDLDILKIAQRILRYAREVDPSLEASSKAYALVAALRVELNAPYIPELEAGHQQAQDLLRAYSKEVLKDPNIRRKSRYGLLLYRYCRPLMRFVYKRLNRWK